MGDHKIITASIGEAKPPQKTSERRSWKHYSKSGLIELLNEVNFDLEIETVQGLYNDIENKLVTVVDKIAPICVIRLMVAFFRQKYLQKYIKGYTITHFYT